MGARTDFEIRPRDGGYLVFSRTSWWQEGGQPSKAARAGGLTRVEPFTSRERAIAWVEEQFSVPANSWIARPDAVLCAGKGDPPPVAALKPVRRPRTKAKLRKPKASKAPKTTSRRADPAAQDAV
jgi:hypothetical protein